MILCMKAFPIQFPFSWNPKMPMATPVPIKERRQDKVGLERNSILYAFVIKLSNFCKYKNVGCLNMLLGPSRVFKGICTTEGLCSLLYEFHGK